MLQDIEFAAGWGWAVSDCVEVAVQLDEVVIMLGLVGRVKVVLAAKVGKGACCLSRIVLPWMVMARGVVVGCFGWTLW